MPVSRTFVAKEIRWNSITWNADNGGPLTITVAHTGNPIMSRTGADLYPRRISIQDRSVVVTVVLGEFKQIMALTGKGTLAADVFYHEGPETVTLSILGMKNYETRSTQNRANPSESAITFIHESVDGLANPLS